jgi:hypothetical protein
MAGLGDSGDDFGTGSPGEYFFTIYPTITSPDLIAVDRGPIAHGWAIMPRRLVDTYSFCI